ncbi:Diaminopimelate decarboxylase [Fundidesulfovibrio magnetotacticus]|uniref:Diaminopimelate decarboxylase n=1 Tax=Fundidesulfovibrio magnetotacticus TaxID=2730080 RepID=A0A6V8LVQ1_9BACT|nr:diaminopimelate decarboxylase [Fundidesulfovibrio magnetotacticus]GFK95010.1 Diaminopimelate decarboxylase [Fundidesulfovibrio magnetotacticus]
MTPSPEHRAAWPFRALALALSRGQLDEDDTAVIVYDLEGLDARLAELNRLFPAGTLHAAAVKAAPLRALLARLCRAGAGLEAASGPELHLSLRAGCPPERVVFDSPAKTLPELRQALALGVHLNADNFQELERMDALDAGSSPAASLGLRVNPQVGEGSIAATSVAGQYSKFGEPLEKRGEIVRAFQKRPWLRGLHMHVGSQGCGIGLFTAGARALLDLGREIDRACGERRVLRLDIGGGLPVSYGPSSPAPSMEDYATALRRECPELWDGPMRAFTEFGRWMFAGQGFAAARVEYVKEQAGQRTAVVHLGADMFLRPCYLPDTWRHELAVAAPDGTPKQGSRSPWNVAGPLCFAGDFLARGRELPDMAPGDWLVVRDAGAYTLSMWSRYNSRQAPKALGVEADGVEVLKARESVEDVLRFWG